MNIAEGTTSDGTIFVNLHNLVGNFFSSECVTNYQVLERKTLLLYRLFS